jgi:hypothetical protein
MVNSAVAAFTFGTAHDDDVELGELLYRLVDSLLQVLLLGVSHRAAHGSVDDILAGLAHAPVHGYAQRLREVGVRIGVDSQDAAVLRETLNQHAGDESLAYPALSR